MGNTLILRSVNSTHNYRYLPKNIGISTNSFILVGDEEPKVALPLEDANWKFIGPPKHQLPKSEILKTGPCSWITDTVPSWVNVT